LFGISLAGGNDAIITGNIITVDEPDAMKPIGISVNLVNNPLILDNTISAEEVTDPGDGIFLVSSSGGQIRNNTIHNHLHGIELGSASPNVGANTITDNLRYGIYINDHSHPDLSEQIVGGDPYPLSGYNTIRENGECNVLPSYSELYLRFNSTVNLEKGCNTIADDRDDPALHGNYLYLIDGSHVESRVNAFRNYWGEVNGGNPAGRFGPSLNVNYGGWQTGPCTYTEIGSALLLANSQGEVYDTVYSSGEAPSELTDIESRYAAANEHYYNNQYTQAKQEYESIIEEYGDSTESLQAYNRLYTLENLMNSSPESFNQLKEFYLQKAANQTDSIMAGTLTHLSDLCLVSATEYITAINNFDEEAQQNPNTDIALYRQIDALTTSLLMPQDSTMNKGTLGKYSVNGLSDYTNKLSELIKTRGKSGLESEEELLPTQFTLYQNYPNPFNPNTTIKYDLPNTSDVSLIIYDILGRKVKELVNTKQQAGRYEIQFNASTLASGVYIYQLIADKFISSKKMILLK
jgi:parallel beta-helix repeat protein